MDEQIKQLITRVKSMSENKGLSAGIAASGASVGMANGTTVINDLYTAAIALKHADTTAKVDEQLDEIVGVLHVAQAMNIIGFNDLEELMDILDKIKSEE